MERQPILYSGGKKKDARVMAGHVGQIQGRKGLSLPHKKRSSGRAEKNLQVGY